MNESSLKRVKFRLDSMDGQNLLDKIFVTSHLTLPAFIRLCLKIDISVRSQFAAERCVFNTSLVRHVHFKHNSCFLKNC